MNPLDLIAVLLVALAVLLGFRSGAIPQVAGLAGAVAGAVLAIVALPLVTDPLRQIDAGLRPFIVLAGMLVVIAIGESIGSAVGRRMATALGTGVLGAADRVGGAFVGAAQALLVIWLAGGLLALGPLPRLTEAAQTSTAVRGLNAVLPPPTEVASELGDLLNASALPEVFVGFEPVPLPPVERPSDATTRRMAAAAEAATLRVMAATCGLATTGSGALIADGYVVTNAHVVAGSKPGGVRVSSADGAALGYPGGGGLRIVPAAITGAYAATGRDIYSEHTVRREILELQAEIDRGDSGGPFILADGTIGGLVFAEARSNEEVGYALSPTDVARRIGPGIGRTGVVATGACLH